MKTRRLDLQRIRQEQKVTQLQLSELTGYPQSFISQIERGKVSVPMSFIKKLGEEFHIDNMDDYVTYIDITKPNKSAGVSELVQAPVQDQKPEVEVQQEPSTSTEKATIDRLVELLERSEQRNEKLEKEVASLRAEIEALKG